MVETLRSVIVKQTKFFKMHFSKYTQNLEHKGEYVYSYGTKVARVEYPKLIQLGWWSLTTQKHVNYAASELGLELDRNGH